MRLKDIKKAGAYFKRIAKDPFSRQSRAAMRRYIKEAFSIIVEKLRGLDFTMVYQCDSSEHNNNYSKSPKHVINRVLEDIDYSESHSIIDMGCGKGYVMALAAKYPFESIGGVEYSQELCTTCKNNLNKLGLKQVKVYNCDAKQFEHYKDYDIFYFCNPFDETILSDVAKRIKESHQGKKCRIYYLNPHQKERQKAITDEGFELLRVIKDNSERYFDVAIYEN